MFHITQKINTIGESRTQWQTVSYGAFWSILECSVGYSAYDIWEFDSVTEE